MVSLRGSTGTRPLIHRLQRKLDAAFPGARFLVRQLEQGPPFEAPIELRLFGPNLNQLRSLGNQVRKVLAETPEVVHVTTDLGEALPTIALNIDEELARLAGVSQIEIANQLEASLEGAVGGLVLEQTEELPIRVRSASDVRSDLNKINSLHVVAHSPDGNAYPIPLASLAQTTVVPKVPAIRRLDSQRMNEVRGYVTAGTLPAQVLNDFSTRLAQAGVSFPPGYRLEYAGEASNRDDAVGNLMSSVGVLAVLMVATLVLSFSSYLVATIIGAVAILAVGLSVGSLALVGYPFGFMAIVGTMGLVGVAINDTIVVLAAIRQNHEATAGNHEALVRVVCQSTRHVLTTTFTTIVGFIPLILAGGEFWPPMAMTIAGGISGATVLALVFGPCCHVMLTYRRQPLSRGTKRRSPTTKASHLVPVTAPSA